VREAQPVGAVLGVPEQKEVDVDRARPVADAALEVAAQVALDRLARVEQRLGLELCRDPDAGVQERRLVQDEAWRAQLSARIRDGRAALFDTRAPVDAFARLLLAE